MASKTITNENDALDFILHDDWCSQKTGPHVTGQKIRQDTHADFAGLFVSRSDVWFVRECIIVCVSCFVLCGVPCAWAAHEVFSVTLECYYFFWNPEFCYLSLQHRGLPPNFHCGTSSFFAYTLLVPNKPSSCWPFMTWPPDFVEKMQVVLLHRM